MTDKTLRSFLKKAALSVELKSIFWDAVHSQKGGPGSGHRRHRGIAGQQGGSAPSMPLGSELGRSLTFTSRRDAEGKVSISASATNKPGGSENQRDVEFDTFPQAKYEVPGDIKGYIASRLKKEYIPAREGWERARVESRGSGDRTQVRKAAEKLRNVLGDIASGAEQIANEAE